LSTSQASSVSQLSVLLPSFTSVGFALPSSCDATPNIGPPVLPWPEKNAMCTVSIHVLSVPVAGEPRPDSSKSWSQARSSPQLKRRTPERLL